MQKREMVPILCSILSAALAAPALAAPAPAAAAPVPVLRVEAQVTRGATCLKRLRDMDGFYYVRNAETNAEGVARAATNALAFVVSPKEAGEWCVFARVRVGATKPLDQEAAFLALVGTNGVASASLRIAGSPGDESWQFLCLGKQKLEPKMRLEVTPGTLNPLRYLDVRDFVLMTPALMESSMPLNK